MAATSCIAAVLRKKGAFNTPSTFRFFKRKTAALISKPPLNEHCSKCRQCNGLYSLQNISNHIAHTVITKKEPIIVNYLTNYRLCVYASGSLITDIFSCCTAMTVSCLHFGQNKGKFSSTVSSRIFMRVLFLHIGQYIQCSFSIWLSPTLFYECQVSIFHRQYLIGDGCYLF